MRCWVPHSVVYGVMLHLVVLLVIEGVEAAAETGPGLPTIRDIDESRAITAVSLHSTRLCTTLG